MKNLRILYMTVLGCLSTLWLSSCQDEEKLLPEQEVQFTINLPQDEATTGRTAAEEPDAVLITIKDDANNTVRGWAVIDLYEFSGEYITKPVRLRPGNYTITNFAVLDSDENVLYATPREGSDKAYLVSDPLAVEFTVSEDKVEHVAPEVISVKESSASEFGYATFSFKHQDPLKINISVFALNNYNKFKLTDAYLDLDAGSEESNLVLVKEINLQKKVNLVPLSRRHKYHRLSIYKSGYDTYVKTFRTGQLTRYQYVPLEVYLEKL